MVKLHENDVKTREVLDWQGVHLFHFSGSSCSQKTRIFLNLKGINWHSHPIDLVKQENYKPWFLGINPRGLVPVLVHDGQVHIESNDILVYLEKAFPAPSLIPEAIYDEIIEGLQQEDDLHLDIRTITMRYVLPGFLARKKPASLEEFANDDGTINGKMDPHKQVEIEFWRNMAEHGITDEQIRTSTGKLKAVFDELERRLMCQPYIAGNSISLLDIAWFIYAFRLDMAGYPLARLHPSVYRWFADLLPRDEFAHEVAVPPPLKLITSALHAMQRLKGSRFEAVANL